MITKEDKAECERYVAETAELGHAETKSDLLKRYFALSEQSRAVVGGQYIGLSVLLAECNNFIPRRSLTEALEVFIAARERTIKTLTHPEGK